MVDERRDSAANAASNEMLTRTQVAELLQLSLPTVAKLIAGGVIPSIRLGPRSVRVPIVTATLRGKAGCRSGAPISSMRRARSTPS